MGPTIKAGKLFALAVAFSVLTSFLIWVFLSFHDLALFLMTASPQPTIAALDFLH